MILLRSVAAEMHNYNYEGRGGCDSGSYISYISHLLQRAQEEHYNGHGLEIGYIRKIAAMAMLCLEGNDG